MKGKISLACTVLAALFTFLCCIPGLEPVHAEGAPSPKRVVSLGPINTENIFLLGAGNLLIANTIYCVRPEAAKNREKIGTVAGINIEKIVRLSPDLILATALTPHNQVETLKRMGLRVVRFSKPRSFQEICTQFKELASLLGRETVADEIVSQAVSATACIQEAVAGHRRPRVLLQVGTNPTFAAVPGSFTNDYIRLGGGINIAAGQHSGRIGDEKVLAMDPEVIIIAIMGSETGMAAQEKRRWGRFPSLSAVRNRAVYTVSPDMVCSPSPATFVESLKEIAMLIHPEAGSAIARCVQEGSLTGKPAEKIP